MDLLKILRALLSSVYKMTDGEIDELLTSSEAKEDTTIAALLTKDKDRVKELLKPKQGQTFQDGYKKAKAEVLSQFEKDIKEKYGIEDEDPQNPLTGIELVAKVIEKEAPEAGKNSLTEDTIKKHPTYLRLEREKNKAVSDKEKEWKEKYETLEKGHKKNMVFSNVKGRALKKLMELNPVLSEKADVATNQQNAWLRELEGMDYEVGEDGTITMLKDGKRVEDDHGNPLEFEDFIQRSASGYFDFKENNGGSGNPGGDEKNKKDTKNTGKYPAGIVKPKTLEDLTKIVNDKNIKPEDRAVVMKVWQDENPNT